MNAGLPGTGIGGLFYLLSALVMPLREGYLALRGRARAGRWRVIVVQMAIAAGILGGMWTAGWLLGLILVPAAPVAAGSGGPVTPNVLRTGMFAIALATLAVVLLAVELLRLIVWLRAPRTAATTNAAPPPAASREQPPRVTRRRLRRRVTLIIAVGIPCATPVAAQFDGVIAGRMVRAESAYAAGDAARAEAEYYAVLSAEPSNSRATYRLAELRQKRDPKTALELYRRYVDLEPGDAWGYVAVGATLVRLGRAGAALKWYDAAGRLAPNERDVVIGRARCLARLRRTSAALAAYEGWLAHHPADAEVLREITPLRRTAAGFATPYVGASTDTDGNRTFRIGASLESPLIKEARFGLTLGQEMVSGGTQLITLHQLGGRAAFRSGAFSAEATLGAVLFGSDRGGPPTTPGPPGGPAAPSAPSDSSGPGQSPGQGPGQNPGGGPGSMLLSLGDRGMAMAQVRARWRPANGPSVDLRAQHGPMTATSQVLAQRVTRSEIRAVVELPVAQPLRLRGMGRAAAFDDSTSLNYRTSIGAGVAFALRPGDVSLNAHEIRFTRPSSAGYFAPRVAQIVEAATYLEFETASLLVALDGGLGLQRSAEFGAQPSAWSRALRLYSLVAWRLAPARDLRLEVEAEDSPLANEAATGAGWRYLSGTLSIRWGL